MLRLKLVAIAKDESPYLAEWIFHHLYLGVHEIEIYMNGITDNSYRIVRRISDFSKQVKFVQSDELLDLSLKAKQSFQLVIYDHAIKNEKASRRFSHLLFLDIDEYLMPEKWRSNVSGLLKQSKDADVVSFLWHSDIPSAHQTPFSPVLQGSIWMKKMCQMKSMCRLDGAAERSKIHTFIANEKNAKSIDFRLSDGSTPSLFNKNKRLSSSDLDRLSGKFEPWFIYHRVFRSHDEYCSSLAKGRVHRTVPNPIKDNRYGYQIPAEKKDGWRFHGNQIEYRINRWQLFLYRCSYALFIRRLGLKKSIAKGQSIAMDRYQKLKKLIDDKPELKQLYSRQLKSTRFEIK